MDLRRFLATCAVIAATGIPVLVPTQVQAFSGGAGTSGDPYQIATCTDLQEIDDTTGNMSKVYVLTTNIDCTGVSFTPLVNGSTYFSGVLDGGGRSISGLSISCSTDYCGMFSRLSAGTVKNLIFSAPSVTSSAKYVGLIAGSGSGSILIDDVSVTGGAVVNTFAGSASDYDLYSYTGGLLGYFSGGTGVISDITSSSTVSGKVGTGGLVGYSAANPLLSITRVTVAGNVSGESFIGGIVGQHYHGTPANGLTIDEANVTASSVAGLGFNVGGILGHGWNITISNSFSSADVTGAATGANRGVSVATGQGAFIGGIAGQIGGGDSTIVDSGSTGDVTATGTDISGTGSNIVADGVGGVLGWDRMTNFYVTRVFHRGTVTGDIGVGAVTGRSSMRLVVTDSYFRTNLVVGDPSTSMYGGMRGQNSGSITITRSYYAGEQTSITAANRVAVTKYDGTGVVTCSGFFFDKELLGSDKTSLTAGRCGGNNGPAAKTTADMKTQSTFTASSWNFTPGSAVWSISPSVNDGYPYLSNVGGQTLAAPTVVLSAVASTSTSRNIQFRLAATTGQIDCSTVSATDGVDFDLTNIVSITIAQTSSTVCTISAVSTISADGATGTSSLAEASSFSVSYSGSANQTNISSGSPASVAVSIPAAATTTTVASTTTTIAQATTTTNTPSSGASATTTTTAGGSPNTTVAPSNTSPTGVAGGATTTIPSRDNGADTDETVTSAASVTTTTTTTVAPTTTLPSIDVPPVSEGGGALTIGGQRVEATITRENNQLVVEAGPIVARISALKREGGRAPLDADGRIRMMTGDSVEVEVTGFGPSTEVEVRLYSEPTLLGRSGVNAEGQLLASYEIPDGISDGDHTVVLAGESREAEELVFALSVAIGEPGEGAPWFTILVLVPLGLAAIGALIIPAVLRRRRSEQPA